MPEPIESSEDKVVKNLLELNKRDQNHVYFSLGDGLFSEYSPKDIKFDAEYGKIGRRLWQAMEIELYEYFCDAERKTPRPWVDDLIKGDTRSLLLGIVAAITSKYNVSLGIAVPATALLFKKGLVRFCKTPINVKPKETVFKILQEYKEYFHGKFKEL